jgi:hypothetical protein
MNARVRIIFTIGAAIGWSLAACDGDPHTAPAAVAVHAVKHAKDVTGPPGRVVACERRTAASDSALISPSGGILRIGANELLVPGGALLEPVMIRGEVPDDTIASIRLFPEGLTFRKPAALVLDTQGCDDPGSSAKILYLSDDGTIIEQIDATYFPRWKRVAAPIDHFSRYALGV